MARVGAIFVGLCMALIAGSLGALMYLYVGTNAAESAIVTLVAFTGLAVYNAVALKARDRAGADGPIADLSRGTTDLARQVIDLGRRVATMESRLDGVLDRVGEAAKPLSDELSELGSLLSQLAETVATHDTLLRSGAPGSPYLVPGGAPPAEAGQGTPAVPGGAAAAAVAAAPGVAIAAPAVAGGPVEPAAGAARAGAFAGLPRETATALVRDAIDGGRVDLLLQPIVMLPQRKVRYYEAVARLRTREGEVVMPADFLPVAEAGGLIARLDNAMLFRCVQIVRRLIGKNRDIGLFCNVSAATLVDPQFFPQFNEFADANRALAPSFVFEFRQDAYRSFGPLENESLAALTERGFRFSLDHVVDMRFEPRDLADRGFRFVKVPAPLLLARHTAATDIHPADLAGLLGRYGIELIGERIESESTVVDLLDYDLKYGQGFLFSAPRPVRPEVLQGGAERLGEPGVLDTRPPAPAAAALAPPAPAPAPMAAAAAAAPVQPAAPVPPVPPAPAPAAQASGLAAILGLRPAVVAPAAVSPGPAVAPPPGIATVIPAPATSAPAPAAVAAPAAAATRAPMPAAAAPPAAGPPAPAGTTAAATTAELPVIPPAPTVAPAPAAAPLLPGQPTSALLPPVIPGERRPGGAARGHPGTVLAQIARGMLARKTTGG